MTDWVRTLTELGSHIRDAARRVADEWPSVTTEDQLTADLSLKVMGDTVLHDVVTELPEYRRTKYLTQVAQQMVAKEVSDFEYNTGNTMYSTGQVRYLLDNGRLMGNRTKITATMPDLDLGCRLLTATAPELAEVIYREFIVGDMMSNDLVAKSVKYLTQAMNSLSKGRGKNLV
jgi:hypothetical protein